MNNIKVCSFVANYTHSCILVNNFISKEFEKAKVIYINEKSEKEKLKNIVNKYFKNMNKKITYVLSMMIVLDIIDGSLRDISMLNGIKIVLYIICFVLLIQNRKEGKK